jgi:hypothetical protein
MSKYFFCYSKQLHKYIQSHYNISYICTALHETTNKKFWLYERNEQLNNALQDYNNIMQQLNI